MLLPTYFYKTSNLFSQSAAPTCQKYQMLGLRLSWQSLRNLTWDQKVHNFDDILDPVAIVSRN